MARTHNQSEHRNGPICLNINLDSRLTGWENLNQTQNLQIRKSNGKVNHKRSNPFAAHCTDSLYPR